MTYKIHIIGNKFYVDELEAPFYRYEGFSKDVLSRTLTPTSSDFGFDKLNNWSNTKTLNFSEIDLTGADYTDLATFNAWLEENTGKSSLQESGQVKVNQGNFANTLGGVIDSDTKYFLEENINMGLVNIDLSGGKRLNIGGYNFNLSGLYSTEDNYTMIVGADSADILLDNIKLEASGDSSKVYDITDQDGTHAIELDKVNYINCTSLGEINSYRQGLEIGTGRLGGSPSLTLGGTWAGGFRVTTSIVRNMSNTTTEPLFKEGVGFVMQSRFLTDINCDLGTLQPLLDFSSSNFPNPSTLEIKNAIITRGGISNPLDINITPNIDATNLSSSWKSNNGIPNTFVGGTSTLTTEILTGIVAVNTPSLIAGVFTPSSLEHYDSPSNGQLRHLGETPREYVVYFDFVLEGNSNDDYRIDLVKDSGSLSIEYSQKRVVNNLAGGRDVAYFTGTANAILNKNDVVYWQVVNLSSSANCTLELDSSWSIRER